LPEKPTAATEAIAPQANHEVAELASSVVGRAAGGAARDRSTIELAFKLVGELGAPTNAKLLERVDEAMIC
jgi:hypothetical protein